MKAKTTLALILTGLLALTAGSALAMGMGGGMGGGMGSGRGWGGFSDPGNTPGYNQPRSDRSPAREGLRRELRELEDLYRSRLADPRTTRRELRDRYEEMTRLKEELDRTEREDRPMSRGGSHWGGRGGLVW